MSKADGYYRVKLLLDSEEFNSKVNAVASTGLKTITAMTASIAGIGVAVTKVGSEFESTFQKATTLFGDVDVNVNKLKSDILSLSNATGKAATELNEAMYDALSAGVEVTEDMASATDFLEKNTKLAIAGYTDVKSAVGATAKVLNAYGMEVKEIDRVANIMLNTQNKGIVTVDELSSSLAQVTPTAAAMNVSFEQVGASLAVMTAKGTPASQAVTQLNQLFAELGKSGTIASENLKKATKGTEYAGKSFVELMDDGVELNTILDLMNQYAEKNGKAMLDMFSSIEAGKAALSIGSSSELFVEDLNVMKNELGTLDSAYEKMMDTFEQRMNQTTQTIKNMGISIWSEIQEPLKNSLAEANEELQEFSSSPEFKNGIKGLASLIEQVTKGFINISKVAIPTLLKGLSWVAEHSKETTLAIGTLTASFAGFKATKMVSDTAKLANRTFELSKKLTEAAKTSKVASGALKALNMTMNPTTAVIAMTVSGLAALTVGMIAYANSNNKALQREIEHKKTLEDFNERMKEAHDLTLERLESSAEEINQLEVVAERMKNLVDENGNYIASKDEIVTAIDEFNQAMGESVYYYDQESGKILDQKGNVVDLRNAINDLVEAKKAQAWIDANQDKYTEALKIQKESVDKIMQSQKELNEIRSGTYANGMNVGATLDEYERLSEVLERASNMGDMSLYRDTLKEIADLRNSLGSDSDKLTDDFLNAQALKSNIDDLKSSAGEVQSIVENVDSMTQAMSERDWEITNLLASGLDAAKLANTNDTLGELNQKIQETEQRLSDMEAVGLDEVDWGKAMYEAEKKNLEDLVAQRDTYIEQHRKLGYDKGQAEAEGQFEGYKAATEQSQQSDNDSRIEEARELGYQEGTAKGEGEAEATEKQRLISEEQKAAWREQQLEQARLDGSETGTAQAEEFSNKMLSGIQTGMSKVVTAVISAWNSFGLDTKHAQIIVDIISSGGGYSGGGTPSAYSMDSPMLMTASEAENEDIAVASRVRAFVAPIPSVRVANENALLSGNGNYLPVKPNGATIVNNKPVTINSTTNFNQPIERPSDVTRAIESRNRDLAKLF